MMPDYDVIDTAVRFHNKKRFTLSLPPLSSVYWNQYHLIPNQMYQMKTWYKMLLFQSHKQVQVSGLHDNTGYVTNLFCRYSSTGSVICSKHYQTRPITNTQTCKCT